MATKYSSLLQENAITIDQFSLPGFIPFSVSVSVLRFDKIHPVISGNKFFKLKYYLQQARQQNKKGIISFGGAWSNHIVATAAICQYEKIASIGIIRGEEPLQYSPTLLAAKAYDMQLFFTNRNEFAKKTIPQQVETPTDFLIVNEGGYGEQGAAGIADMLLYFDARKYTHICCAVGTGTMLAGLLNAMPQKNIIGISVLKNNVELRQAVFHLLKNKNREIEIIADYHFGGYAKKNNLLIEKMNQYFKASAIPTDFVYTGKLFYAVEQLIQQHYFPVGSKILIIHSGGLQGNASVPKGTLIF